MVEQSELERIINKAYEGVISESQSLPSVSDILNYINLNNFDLIFGEEAISIIDLNIIENILKLRRHAFRKSGFTENDCQTILSNQPELVPVRKEIKELLLDG